MVEWQTLNIFILKGFAIKKVNINKEEFVRTCNESVTMSKACSKLGMKFSTFIRYAKKFGCYTPNQGAKGTNKRTRPKYNLSDILRGNHPEYGRSHLKRRLINEKVLDYKCNICGISEWNTKKLSLHLDHINGISNDHRLENLRLLCPNCHSQTETWCGKKHVEYNVT